MPMFYHITDYGAIDNTGIPAGSILHESPDAAWASWGRRKTDKTNPAIYKVQVPWAGVQIENQKYTCKQVLHDVVLSPYRNDTDPASNDPIDRAYTTTRRRKQPADRFQSSDPYQSYTPTQLNCDPPGRVLRGPHNLSLIDMVRTTAHVQRRLRRLAARLSRTT